MTAEPEQHEANKRKRFGAGYFVVLLLLLLMYVLSPPFVVKLFHLGIYAPFEAADAPIYNGFYAPLRFLSDKVPFVAEFYEWYFGRFYIFYLITPRFVL